MDHSEQGPFVTTMSSHQAGVTGFLARRGLLAAPVRLLFESDGVRALRLIEGPLVGFDSHASRFGLAACRC